MGATEGAPAVLYTTMDMGRLLADDLDSAFPELVLAWQDGVFSTALRVTGHYHDAEDIAQETFVRVYRSLKRMSPDEIAALNLRPYVWRTTVNLCRNRWRSRSRRPETSLANESDIPSDEHVDTIVELDEWQQRLDQLSPAQREAVVLRHLAGLSYEEVSGAMDIPVGTAKAHVHRGIGRLRQAVEATQGVVTV